jgi:hypothetical protein
VVGTWLVAGSSEWVMGSPYPDSTRRLRLVGGWVEHNDLFPVHLIGVVGVRDGVSAHCWVLRRQPLLV